MRESEKRGGGGGIFLCGSNSYSMEDQDYVIKGINNMDGLRMKNRQDDSTTDPNQSRAREAPSGG